MIESVLHVLRTWPGLWAYPDLMIRLEDPKPMSASELAGLVVRGLARPISRREAIESLIERGRFGHAEDLLEDPVFAKAMEVIDLKKARSALDAAVEAARVRIDFRLAKLRRRARAIGSEPPAEQEARDALRDSIELAEELLGLLEEQIAGKEGTLSEALRDKLDAIAPKNGEATAAWRRSVETCLDATELEAALFMLAEGPTGDVPELPDLVPRPRGWSTGEQPGVIIGWLAHQADPPAGFLTRHLPGVGTADLPLIGLLDLMLHREAVDAVVAGAFATALDAALGSASEEAAATVPRQDGFEVRLHALSDPRLPCLYEPSGLGARLWVPASASALPGQDMSGEGMFVQFSPRSYDSSARGRAGFDTVAVLRVISQRDYRRVNFLREVGHSVHPEDAIPTGFNPPSAVERGRYPTLVHIAWMLDLLDVVIHDREVIEMVAFYSAADWEILTVFMQVLFGSLAGERPQLTVAAIEHVWQSEVFRSQGIHVIRGRIRGRPGLQIALGAALFVGGKPGQEFAAEDVIEALDVMGLDISGSCAIVEDLATLETLGLLSRGSSSSRWLIPISGIGHLLLDAIADGYAYVREVSSQLRKP